MTTIGGIALESAGTGLYSGYVLSGGDEFTALDLMSATNPTGKYFTTRTYQSTGGARAPASGPLAVMHDVSPDYTGWQDANRGVPVPSFANSHQIVTGEGTSALRLLAIRQSSAEQVLLASGVAGQIERTAMVSGVGALWWDSPAIIDFRVRMPAGPHGQHPTLWAFATQPPGGPTFTGNEYGWECGNTKVGAYHDVHTNGTITANSETDIANYREGNWHTFTVVVGVSDYKYYVDGVLVKTLVLDPNSSGDKPDHMLITHHVYNATYQAQIYDPLQWAPGVLPNGIELDIEWFRVWRLSTGTHYVPLTTLADVLLSSGDTVSVTLPAQTVLWGASGLAEYLTCVQNEVEEPGSSNTASYAQLPAGLSWDAPSRTLSGTMPAKPGALYVVVGISGDGNTCVPARFRLCGAPKYTAGALQWTKNVPVSVDVYTRWNTGRMFQAGTNPKGLSVSGLPQGLSFDSTTGLITGTPAPAGNGSGVLTLSATNSAGQTTTATESFVAATTGKFIGLGMGGGLLRW
jgi:hypothetical protein